MNGAEALFATITRHPLWPAPAVVLTVLAALLLIAVFDRARRRLWIFVPLVLPATLLHEGSHWLVAALTGAQPAGFKVWPRREGARIVLGEVRIGNGTLLTRGLVGLAPLLLLPCALLLVLMMPVADSPWAQAAVAYLLASLLYGSIPSMADWRLAARGWPGALLLLGALAAGAWALLRFGG